MTERRYNEDEVALILRSAVDVRAGDATASPSDGLTLTELKEIGAEVGLDGGSIERAARALDTRERTPPTARLLGQPTTAQYERVVPIRLGEKHLPHLLDTIRSEFARQGVVDEVLGGFEWRARSGMGGRYVSIRPEGDQTRIRVLGNYRDGLLATLLGAGPLAGVAAAGLLTTVPVLANPFVLIPVGVAAGWSTTIPFRHAFKKERVSLERVLDTLEQRLLELGDADLADD